MHRMPRTAGHGGPRSPRTIEITVVARPNAGKLPPRLYIGTDQRVRWHAGKVERCIDIGLQLGALTNLLRNSRPGRITPEARAWVVLDRHGRQGSSVAGDSWNG